MTLNRSIKKTGKIIKLIKAEADKLYVAWGHGELKGTIASIKNLKASSAAGWGPKETAMAAKAEHDIRKVRTDTIQAIVDHKQDQDRGAEGERPSAKFFARDVKVMELMFPDLALPDGEQEWCRYAKKAAFAMEKFHSHVMRKNPHPKREGEYNDSREDFRSEAEQAWLQEQDKLGRVQKKLAYLERKRDELKEMSPEERAQHKEKRGKRKRSEQEPGHRRVVVPRHKKPEEPMPENPGEMPPFPERRMSRRAPAIVPYERARVASRLPAFPAFPAYRRK